MEPRGSSRSRHRRRRLRRRSGQRAGDDASRRQRADALSHALPVRSDVPEPLRHGDGERVTPYGARLFVYFQSAKAWLDHLPPNWRKPWAVYGGGEGPMSCEDPTNPPAAITYASLTCAQGMRGAQAEDVSDENLYDWAMAVSGRISYLLPAINVPCGAQEGTGSIPWCCVRPA